MKLSEIFQRFNRPKIYPMEYEDNEETKYDTIYRSSSFIPLDMLHTIEKRRTIQSIAQLSNSHFSGVIEYRYPVRINTTTTLHRFLEDS